MVAGPGASAFTAELLKKQNKKTTHGSAKIELRSPRQSAKALSVEPSPCFAFLKNGLYIALCSLCWPGTCDPPASTYQMLDSRLALAYSSFWGCWIPGLWLCRSSLPLLLYHFSPCPVTSPLSFKDTGDGS